MGGAALFPKTTFKNILSNSAEPQNTSWPYRNKPETVLIMQINLSGSCRKGNVDNGDIMLESSD